MIKPSSSSRLLLLGLLISKFWEVLNRFAVRSTSSSGAGRFCDVRGGVIGNVVALLAGWGSGEGKMNGGSWSGCIALSTRISYG